VARPLFEEVLFKKNLNAKTIIEHDLEHFTNDQGKEKLSAVVNKLELK